MRGHLTGFILEQSGRTMRANSELPIMALQWPDPRSGDPVINKRPPDDFDLQVLSDSVNNVI